MKKIIRAFFYSKDNFQPIYFWTTIFMSLLCGGILFRYMGDKHISDALLIGLGGFMVSMLGCYNYFKDNGVK